MGNQIGTEGEKVIAQHLQQKGYTLLVCNYRGKRGEIDLIAKKNNTVHFIEVKTMLHISWENISYIVDIKKQRKITQTAKQFILENRQYNSMDMQFDVAILLTNPFLQIQPDIMFIENAFGERND